MKNRFVVSRQLEENEAKKDELFERFISGKLSFTDETTHMKVLEEVFQLHKDRYKINQEIIDKAAESFAIQFKNDSEVRSVTYLMFTFIVLMREVLNEFMDTHKEPSRTELKRQKRNEESMMIFEKYVKELKMFMVEAGPVAISKKFQVHDLTVEKSNVDGRYSIRIDVTTTNLYKIFKHICKRRLYPGKGFEYKSVKSLGQVIRYYKDELVRRGYRILTYREDATHIVIDYVLTTAESLKLEREQKRKEWF